MTADRFSLSQHTGRWILISAICASSMAFIDGTALSVALDALQKDPQLRASGLDLIWIHNVYLLMLASLILIGGVLGDRFGRKRVFGLGIVLFAGSSLACGLATSTGMMIVARGIQGVGGALMVPGSLALIAALFVPGERGRAIGIWSAASTITTVGGPILGGLFVQWLSWRFVFFINLPLALIALYGLRQFPENRDENAPQQLDYLGAGLVALGLAGLSYGLVSLNDQIGAAADTADSGGSAVIALIIGIIALIAFALVEARSRHPMVDLRVFRSRTFSGVNLMTAFLYGALSGVLFFLPLNLLQIQGYNPSQVGLALLPFGIILAVLSPWAGGLLDKYGARIPLTVGPAVVGSGFALLAANGITSGVDAYLLTFFPPVVLIGVGMGITVAPLTASVMGALPAEKSGVASGVNNAVTRSSQALVTAIFGSIALLFFTATLTTRAEALPLEADARAALVSSARQLGNTQPPDGLPTALAEQVQMAISLSFVETFRLVAVVGALLCFISALLSLVILRPEARIVAKSTTI